MPISKASGFACAWALALAPALAPALALAAPKTPDDWYKEGDTQFNLGNFDRAIDAFKKGFELKTSPTKRPAYLYNIAFVYREAKNCKDAVFFYRRYLSLKDSDKVKPLTDKKRTEIERIIDELDRCVKQQESIARPPPEGPDAQPADRPKPTPAVKPKVTASAPNEATDQGDHEVAKAAPAAQGRVFSLRALGGGAKIKSGGLDVPIQASLGLIGGYPVAINDKLTLELGAAFLFSPVPFEIDMTSRSAQLISVLANVGATYQLGSRIGMRGELGLGALVFAGVSQSPFTDGKATTGALTMPAVRVGVSVDFAITPNVLASLAPIAFSYSPPKAGLRADITSITRLDFMIGLGYRM